MDKSFWLFSVYKDLAEAVRMESVHDIVDDIIKFYPELFEALETEFKRRQMIKEVGALLVKGRDANST